MKSNVYTSDNKLHLSVDTNLSFIFLLAGGIARVEVLTRSKIDSRALPSSGQPYNQASEAQAQVMLAARLRQLHDARKEREALVPLRTRINNIE